MTACDFCDLPVDARPVTAPDVDGEFCCRGCLGVYRALGRVDGAAADATEQGAGLTAAGTAMNAEAGTDAGTAASADGTRQPGSRETAYFAVEGMHCTACERFLEAVATDVDGVVDAAASYATEAMAVDYDANAVGRETLSDRLSRWGYRVADPTDDGSVDGAGAAFERHRAAVAVLASMPIMAFYVLFVYPTYLGIYPRSFLYTGSVTTTVFVPLTVWSTLVVAGIGYPYFRGAVVGLRVGQPNTDVLVSLAVLAAYGYSLVSLVVVGSRTVYFDVAAMILTVVTVGSHVETRVRRRAREGRSTVATAGTTTATRRRADGTTEEIDPGEARPGDHLVVAAGEQVPLDGTVVEGTAPVDESLVTGESVPRIVTPGETVVGGATVTDDGLVVAVDADAESTLDRLLERTWALRSADPGVQRHADRFAVLFVPAVVLLALATTVGWVALGRPVGEATLVGVAVLVISCPCSLGIATPLALASGVRAAVARGALVLDSTLLERAPDSDVVVVDKTGTLTTGSMTVAGVDAEDADRLLERAGAVETRASHPIGTAVVDAAPDALPAVSAFERTARAVAGTVDGQRVTVGHPTAFDGDVWTVPEPVERAVAAARDAGEVPTVVGWGGSARGVIRVRDEPREAWGEALDDLRSADRRVVVLTGDDERLAAPFAAHPAVDEVFAGVRPSAKERVVRGLGSGETVTMIGDGTNDAAALAAADAGVAMGSGTDLSIDAADAVVVADDLRAISALFDVAAATRTRIRQNLGWALAYNAVALPLAVAGLVNPLVAAALMAASSLLVVANSRRPLLDD